MIIVIIQWFIKPECVTSFQEFWKTQVPVKNRTGLIGEYLSSVVPPAQLPFPSHPLSSDAAHSFVPLANVGVWESAEAFEAEIGKYIPAAGTLLEFEALPRKRTVLSPEAWRVGEALLPTADSPDTL